MKRKGAKWHLNRTSTRTWCGRRRSSVKHSASETRFAKIWPSFNKCRICVRARRAAGRKVRAWGARR